MLQPRRSVATHLAVRGIPRSAVDGRNEGDHGRVDALACPRVSRAGEAESPRERFVPAEVCADRVEQAALTGVAELPGRRIPHEAMSRHETANRAFGSAERP